MPPVISNASPLIALATCGQLELLRRLFDTVIIPPAVRVEVLTEAALVEVQAAISQGWLSEQQPVDGLTQLDRASRVACKAFGAIRLTDTPISMDPVACWPVERLPTMLE